MTAENNVKENGHVHRQLSLLIAIFNCDSSPEVAQAQPLFLVERRLIPDAYNKREIGLPGRILPENAKSIDAEDILPKKILNLLKKNGMTKDSIDVLVRPFAVRAGNVAQLNSVLSCNLWLGGETIERLRSEIAQTGGREGVTYELSTEADIRKHGPLDAIPLIALQANEVRTKKFTNGELKHDNLVLQEIVMQAARDSGFVEFDQIDQVRAFPISCMLNEQDIDRILLSKGEIVDGTIPAPAPPDYVPLFYAGKLLSSGRNRHLKLS